MRKLVAGLIALLIAPSAFATSSPPTANELRNRYIQFRGGEVHLQDMKVVERDGQIRFSARGAVESGSYHTCVEYSSKVAVSLDLPETPMFERWTESGGAQMCDRAFAKCSPAGPEKAEELKSTVLVANREILSHDTDWTKAQVALESRNVAKVTVGVAYYRIEIDSGRLLEQGYTDSGRRREYGDWHRVDNVVFPFYFADYLHGKLQYSVQLSAVIESPSMTAWCSKTFQ